MVTAPELARRLGVNPKTLRAWLRRKARAGHPLLAGHVHQERWEFSEEVANRLAAEYRGGGRRSPRRDPVPSPDAGQPKRRTAPEPSEEPGHRVLETWRGQQTETLEDLLRPGLRAVVVGINPAPASVAAGHYYQGRLGRTLWRRLRRVGLLEDQGAMFEDDAAFADGVGFTDVVKRPSASAADLSEADYEHGKSILVAKLERHRPGLIILAFKKAATALVGPFSGHGLASGIDVAGIPAFIMPGPYEKTEPVSQALDDLHRSLG